MYVENKKNDPSPTSRLTQWNCNNMSKTASQLIKSEPTGGSRCPKPEVTTRTQDPLEHIAISKRALAFHSPENGAHINPL